MTRSSPLPLSRLPVSILREFPFKTSRGLLWWNRRETSCWRALPNQALQRARTSRAAELERYGRLPSSTMHT